MNAGWLLASLGLGLTACSGAPARHDTACAEAAAEAKRWGCDGPATPTRLLTPTGQDAENCARIRSHSDAACS